MSQDADPTMQPVLGDCPGRRCVLGALGGAAVAGAAMLSGCAVYGDEPSSGPAEPVQPTPAPAGTPSELEGNATDPADPSSTPTVQAAGPPLARLDDVPVGGGLVLAGDRLVLTRPAEQTVKAFSAVCTHAGCVVSDVTDGTVNCACHGSKFAIEDGAPTAGPARGPLAPVSVTVVDGAVLRS